MKDTTNTKHMRRNSFNKGGNNMFIFTMKSKIWNKELIRIMEGLLLCSIVFNQKKKYIKI